MVKTHKMFCIDPELVEKLSLTEGSASQLVNNLLKNHFGKGEEELKTEEKELKNRLKMVKNDQKVIENVKKEAKTALDLQMKKEEIRENHRKAFENEREKLSEKVKNKELSFEEFREATQILKDNYGF